MSTAAGVSAGLHLSAAATADGPWRASVTPERAGWAHSGLRILDLPPGGSVTFGTAADEVVVVPLAGSCAVECDGEQFELAGRPGVFAGVTDFAATLRFNLAPLF